MPRWIQAFLVPVVLVVCGFWAQAVISRAPERLPRDVRPPTPVAVPLLEVQPRRLDRTYTGLGDLEPHRVATVAAEVTGVVEEVPADRVGQAVEVDQVVLRLDDRDLALALEEARAREAAALAARQRLVTDRTLGQAERDLQEKLRDLAEAEVPRREGLLEKELVIPSTLELARIQAVREALRLAAEERRLALLGEDAASAEAEVRVRQALRERAERDLEKTLIRAPFAGRISARSVEVGHRVAPGTVLFEVTDLSQLHVEVSVPASLVDSLRVGAEATVEVLGTPRTVEGRVREIHPRADQRNRTFTVVVAVPNERADPVLPGQAARVTLRRSPREGALALPASAVTLRGGRHVVFRLASGAPRLEQVPVVVGEALDGWLVIVEGLQAGDQVAAQDLERLYDSVPWIAADEHPADAPPTGSTP